MITPAGKPQIATMEKVIASVKVSFIKRPILPRISANPKRAGKYIAAMITAKTNFVLNENLGIIPNTIPRGKYERKMSFSDRLIKNL